MADKKIRVLRLLEYVYDNSEAMIKDMERWQVQGVETHGHITIRSVTLSPEILDDAEESPIGDSVQTAVGRMGSSGYIKFLPEYIISLPEDE